MRANHLRRVSLLPDTANDQLPQDSPVLWQRAESHRLADLQPPGEDFNEACGGVDLFDLAEACTACTPENHIRYITHTRAHEGILDHRKRSWIIFAALFRPARFFSRMSAAIAAAPAAAAAS